MLDLREVRQRIQALTKDDDKSRRQAIQSLKVHEKQDWDSAPADVIQSLVAALQQHLLRDTKQASVRREIVAILGNLGPLAKPAIPQLIELLQSGPDAGREATAVAVQAVRVLGDIGCADQRVRTALLDFWLTSLQSPFERVHLAIALCKLKIDANGLVKFLTSTLVANQDASFRKAAIEALTLCRKDELDVVPALLSAALHDKDEDVRQRADAALTALGVAQPKAMQMCGQQLKDSAYAETALRHGGAAAIPALVDALKTDEPITQQKAARTLGALGEAAAEAVPALTRTLNARDLDVRLAAAKSLWNVNKNADAVVPVLIDLLATTGSGADVNETRRQYIQTVIEALWRIGPAAEAATSALLAKVKDKNRLISESAAKALKVIAPAAALKKGLR